MVSQTPNLAVIDLGTNTFHLLIGRFGLTQIEEVYQLQIPVKIGQGGINKGFITPEAMERAISALQTFAETLAQYQVSKVIATGTSAIRNAKNGQELLNEIYDRFGFEVQQIDGNREAELIHKGVSYSFTLPPSPIWIMDIGGGSVEFILAQQQDIIWKRSYEIGAARLIDKFPLGNPASPSQILAIENYLAEILIEVWEQQKLHHAVWFAGSAGSFDTLREVLTLDLGQTIPNLSQHAHEVSWEQLQLYKTCILTSTIESRKLLKGVPSFRSDMIVAASILMCFVIERLGSTRIIASHYALKEGLLAAIH
jgi:exopolyphosphatase / guanosine-5'-triphosphate,3'-diphosphate pyrophosphatase